MADNMNITIIPAQGSSWKHSKTEGSQNFGLLHNCRVSTDSEEQSTSYEAPGRALYKLYYKGNPEWETAGDMPMMVYQEQTRRKRDEV